MKEIFKKRKKSKKKCLKKKCLIKEKNLTQTFKKKKRKYEYFKFCHKYLF